MSKIVLYHNDLDGRCSAAIVNKKFKGECVNFPVSYENKIPFNKITLNDDVVIVDFTPNFKEDFDEIIERSNSVTWIDHHKANILEHKDKKHLDGKRVDTVPSAALATWNYYYPNKNAPMSVVYVSDFDTWTHKYPESRFFELGVSTVSHFPEDDIWETLLNDNKESKEEVDVFISRGKIISKYKSIHNEEYLSKYGYEVKFEGYKAIACNVAHCGSDFFISDNNYDLLIPWVFNGDRFVYSLYSTKIDCSKIAKKYGGGGHKGASGFDTKKYIL